MVDAYVIRIDGVRWAARTVCIIGRSHAWAAAVHHGLGAAISNGRETWVKLTAISQLTLVLQIYACRS